MSSSTVRATCPGCQQPLRIPRELMGQPVKCKKCGTVIRSKAPAPAAAPPQAGYPQPYPAPEAHPHSYAPPAGYGTPGYPQPVPVPAHNPLAMDTEPTSSRTRKYRGKGKYRKSGNGAALYLTIGFGLVLILGLTAAGIYLPGYIKKHQDETAQQGTAPATTTVNSPAATSPVAGLAPIPRRMLFVQLNNYLYLNPLTSAASSGRGGGPDRTRAVAKRMAYDWRVPTEKENNQLYVLSDNGSIADIRAPYRNVLNETFQKFFDTSRAQDRIFVYFGGHATEIEGKAYIVPIEGDPEDVASLIPLDEFYARLAACKAQQKVMVWDVCRYNPQRGKTRKGSEPMSEGLEKALATAPAGVEVVLTCSKDQYALEFFGHQVPGETSDNTVTGSSFLGAALYVANKNRSKVKAVSPTDPLPVKEWVEALGKRVADVAQSAPQEDGKAMAQQPKLVGAPQAEAVAYNPNEPWPTRFELPQPPKGASPDLVAAIREEIALPGLFRADTEDDGLGSFPFPADKLEPFKAGATMAQIMANKDNHKFELAVIESYEKIRKIWSGEAAGTKMNSEIRRVFEGETSDAAKKTIKDDQIFPALAILDLEEVVSNLTKLEAEREKAPKRWQANYDFVLAQAKSRLAFMNEYNLLLGQIFTPEVLPVLDREKAGHTGWALSAKEKMKSKRDIQAHRDDARELYAQIIEQYKGTPWEIQAKREKGVALGLEWQPYTPGSKLMD